MVRAALMAFLTLNSPAALAQTHGEPPSTFRLLGEPVANERMRPTIEVHDRILVVRGTELQRPDGPLRAQASWRGEHSLWLEFYDSLPGAPHGASLAPNWHQVRYEVQIGPLEPGQYSLRLARF